MEVRTVHAKISSLAAESMFHNVDILAEILRRLPSKSLMRFKSVCKSWRALIISRYFCLLWRQHRNQCPGILLTSPITHQQHGYVPLSGPKAGVLQFEIPRKDYDFIMQSCDGFLLLRWADGIIKLGVYNPATEELVVLPPLRMDACKIHARSCSCFVEDPVLAFDSHSRRRVVIAFAIHISRSKPRYTCQVCVMENRGGAWRWRSSSEPFESSRPSMGVPWRNFVVWLNPSETLLYDVGGEALRVCDPPAGLRSDFFYCIEAYFSYHLGESGGHLHFIRDQGGSLIINEMKHDLSGWFVKHNIELSQIEASLFRSIGWDSNAAAAKFRVNFLVEEKDEDPKLVLGCDNDVVLYRIRDQKSWKLCEWEFKESGIFLFHYYFHRYLLHHVETISRFHDQY